MKTAKLALKPYLEKIEQLCEPLGKEALTGLIVAMARQAAPEERGVFLAALLSCLPAESKQEAAARPASENKLLTEIAGLRQEILDRISAIEDGSYWDDPDEDWQDPYYNDEDPDLLSDDQQSALHSFFTEAGQLFAAGAKGAAQLVYGALLSLVNDAETSSSLLLDFDVDLREARAHYARCVYESAAAGERVNAMLAAMEADQAEDDMGGLPGEDYPLLQDVVDAETGPLAGFDQFLPAWEKALGRKDFQEDRLADLRLEAAFLLGGVAAVADLARGWQAKQPRGYLGWLRKLEDAGDWSSLRDAGREALDGLPHGKERRKAAVCLIRAGKKLGEDGVILAGYRERFRSQPDEASLLELVAEAERQQVRKQELAEVCAFLAGRKCGYGENVLQVKALLMAGRVAEAFALCERNEPVGWSYGSATGLLFAGLLHQSCAGQADCSLVRELLHDYADCHSIYPDSVDEPDPDPEVSGFQEVVRGLGLADAAAADLSRYRQWARNIGEKRINHIVANKQRGAYDRAAQVLAALAEDMTAAGKKKEAQALLQDYCKVRYNRHVAFRKEVREAVGKSIILRGMAAGL